MATGEAGWDVRYEPGSTVRHDGPDDASAPGWAAAPSTAPPPDRWPGGIPDSLAPLRTSAWTAAVWALAWRPPAGPGAGTWPPPCSSWPGGSTGSSTIRSQWPAGSPAAARPVGPPGPATRPDPRWSPALVLGLGWRRTRRAAALALLVPALDDWVADRAADLDPFRYAALHVADDVAYGSGVWLGCLERPGGGPWCPASCAIPEGPSKRHAGTSLLR